MRYYLQLTPRDPGTNESGAAPVRAAPRCLFDGLRRPRSGWPLGTGGHARLRKSEAAYRATDRRPGGPDALQAAAACPGAHAATARRNGTGIRRRVLRVGGEPGMLASSSRTPVHAGTPSAVPSCIGATGSSSCPSTAGFGEGAAVEHRDAIREPEHAREVVRDEQHREAEPAAAARGSARGFASPRSRRARSGLSRITSEGLKAPWQGDAHALAACRPTAGARSCGGGRRRR